MVGLFQDFDPPPGPCESKARSASRFANAEVRIECVNEIPTVLEIFCMPPRWQSIRRRGGEGFWLPSEEKFMPLAT